MVKYSIVSVLQIFLRVRKWRSF